MYTFRISICTHISGANMCTWIYHMFIFTSAYEYLGIFYVYISRSMHTTYLHNANLYIKTSLLHLQGRCGAFLVAKRGKVSCSVHSCLSVCCRPPPPLWSSCFSRSPPFYRNAPPVLSYICIFTSRYLDPSTGLSMIYLFVHTSAQITHVCTWISIYMFACKYLSKFRISVVAICI